MSKLSIVKAATDVTIYVFVQNSSSTTGAGLTGLVYNSASLTCYYVRPLAAGAALTLATQTVTGAHSDGGFVEVSSTNMPGWYRLDLSDAVCATGVNSVGLQLKGATNMAPVNIEIELTSVNFNDAVRGGMTSLPNANADAAGGLPVSDAGGLDLDSINSRIPAALVGGRMDSNMGAISGDATAADSLEAALDGTGGVTLTLGQLAFNPTGSGDCIDLGGSGSGNGIGFSRSGAGDVFDANVAAAIQAEATDALNAYDGPTNSEFEARTPTAAQLAYIVANAATGVPVTFTTSGGSTTAAVFNQVDGAAPSATNDQYNGRLLVFTDGTLKGVVTDITDYVGSTTTATITAIPTAPTSSHNARLI